MSKDERNGKQNKTLLKVTARKAKSEEMGLSPGSYRVKKDPKVKDQKEQDIKEEHIKEEQEIKESISPSRLRESYEWHVKPVKGIRNDLTSHRSGPSETPEEREYNDALAVATSMLTNSLLKAFSTGSKLSVEKLRSWNGNFESKGESHYHLASRIEDDSIPLGKCSNAIKEVGRNYSFDPLTKVNDGLFSGQKDNWEDINKINGLGTLAVINGMLLKDPDMHCENLSLKKQQDGTYSVYKYDSKYAMGNSNHESLDKRFYTELGTSALERSLKQVGENIENIKQVQDEVILEEWDKVNSALGTSENAKEFCEAIKDTTMYSLLGESMASTLFEGAWKEKHEILGEDKDNKEISDELLQEESEPDISQKKGYKFDLIIQPVEKNSQKGDRKDNLLDMDDEEDLLNESEEIEVRKGELLDEDNLLDMDDEEEFHDFEEDLVKNQKTGYKGLEGFGGFPKPEIGDEEETIDESEDVGEEKSNTIITPSPETPRATALEPKSELYRRFNDIKHNNSAGDFCGYLLQKKIQEHQVLKGELVGKKDFFLNNIKHTDTLFSDHLFPSQEKFLGYVRQAVEEEKSGEKGDNYNYYLTRNTVFNFPFDEKFHTRQELRNEVFEAVYLIVETYKGEGVDKLINLIVDKKFTSPLDGKPMVEVMAGQLRANAETMEKTIGKLKEYQEYVEKNKPKLQEKLQGVQQTMLNECQYYSEKLNKITINEPNNSPSPPTRSFVSKVMEEREKQNTEKSLN